MKLLTVILLAALLMSCDLTDPKERVAVSIEACCEYTADSVYVAGHGPLLVLRGPNGEIDADSERVEAEVRPGDCSELWLWLVETHWDNNMIPWFPVSNVERGERLFAFPLPGCGEFVLEVNWAENLATVKEI